MKYLIEEVKWAKGAIPIECLDYVLGNEDYGIRGKLDIRGIADEPFRLAVAIAVDTELRKAGTGTAGADD
jgi:hypothetical protein